MHHHIWTGCCDATGVVAGIATEMSVWEGVVVTPSDKAFEKVEKEEDGKNGAEEQMETQE